MCCIENTHIHPMVGFFFKCVLTSPLLKLNIGLYHLLKILAFETLGGHGYFLESYSLDKSGYL